ncbi:MAG TPA: pilus assembly protein PilM [Candidatus Omnitrophota bacterium]|nr:pilus assembly protein PilM [Candidatus Omnitrophota bacterium]HRY85907.1 pilus assembly protein PilM [Candidatus Omnitrophota bacterium]
MAKGVGVYIGNNEVIAVSTAYVSMTPVIKSFAIEPINPEAPQEPMIGKEAHKFKKLSPESRAIVKALEKIKEPGAYVNAAISPSQVATRHFIMPAVPKKDEPGAVRHEASRYIPFKISESIIDYHAQMTHRNVFSVTASAVRAEVLEKYLEDLRAASTKVLMIEPAYTAVARGFAALNMARKMKANGFVILQSDGNVNITLASKGIVYLSRDFILSGKIDEDKNRFAEELRASLDYFYKLTGGEAIEQIFLAGAGDFKVWIEHLEHAFNYTIRFDVAQLPSAKNITPENLNMILAAFGASLRSLGYSSPLGEIKLLPKDERRSSLKNFLIFLGIECLAILILFAAVRFVIFQPYLMHLQARSEAVLGNANRENPNYASLSLESLTAEREKLGARVRQLKTFFGDKYPTSVFLMSLGQGLPQSIKLEYVSLEKEPGKAKKRLNIRGTCSLGNAEKETLIVSSWVKSLSARKVMADSFSEIKLEEIKREKTQDRGITRFRVVGE